MALFLPRMFFTGALLLSTVSSALAITGPQIFTPPGNYSNTPLNPNTVPPSPLPAAPYGYDLVLEENVPGVTYQSPNTVPPGGTPREYPAATVTSVDVVLSESMSTIKNSDDQYPLSQPLPIAGVVQSNVTGPTGTYQGGTIGAGKTSYNTLGHIYAGGYRPGSSIIVYYQFKYTVHWFHDSPGPVGPTTTVVSDTRTIYGPVFSYIT
jgi:hypothetical protein